MLLRQTENEILKHPSTRKGNQNPFFSPLTNINCDWFLLRFHCVVNPSHLTSSSENG